MCTNLSRSLLSPFALAAVAVLASTASAPPHPMQSGSSAASATSTTTVASSPMKAVRMHDYGDASKLVIEDALRPSPAAG